MQQPKNEVEALFALKSLISDRIGLFFSENDITVFRMKLSKSFEYLNVTSLMELHEKLASSQEPIPDAVISALTVGETYFFRSMEQMDAIKNYLIPQISERLPYHSDITIWIPGCATGEEAYTLAMLFSEFMYAVTRDKINFVASDINKGFLNVAEQGIYRERSMRTSIPPWAKKYFSQKNGTYAVCQEIRDRVRFISHNLVEDWAPVGPETTLIVCRNVLIYFSIETQKKVWEGFSQTLHRGGYLVLGPSESLLHRSDFHAHFVDDAIIYQRKSVVAGVQQHISSIPAPIISTPIISTPKISTPIVSTRRITESRVKNALPLPAFRRPTPKPMALRSPLPQPLVSRPSSPAPTTLLVEKPNVVLEQVFEAINDDRLSDALYLLQQYHQQVPLSAEAWVIQAQIYEQLGNDSEALECLRKARFIDGELIVAYYLSAAIEQRLNHPKEAKRYYLTALRLLSRVDDNSPISYCNGMRKKVLEEHIESTVEKIS